MPNIELGFLEHCESWRLESRFFPSKVGGKPAWLSLKPLPSSDELTCEKCGKIMVFLCQIYAPYDLGVNEKPQLNHNFHRTIFVFLCRNSGCYKYDNQNIKIFRSTLARKNDFYSINPPKEEVDTTFQVTKWSQLCNLCGIFARKKCGQCKNVVYCCRDHQIIDWKNGHKSQCSSSLKQASQLICKSSLLFHEWELVTEKEEIQNELLNEEEAMVEYRKLEAEGKTGVLDDVAESDLDAHASSETDKVFAKFKKRIEFYPDQVVRYSRGGDPLFIAKEPSPSNIPSCEYCGGPRQFEFQIMPQMLSELKEHDLDWGVLLVYTCKESCIGDSINSYKKEYVFKQDVTGINI